MAERCTGITAAGRPCRAWAVRGTHPPRCSAHGGRRVEGAAAAVSQETGEGRRDAGGPEGRQDAGGPERADSEESAALRAQIVDLDARIACLGRTIDAQWEVLDVRPLCLLLDLYSKMLARVTRMRRARQALGGTAREIEAATMHVLDELEQEWTET